MWIVVDLQEADARPLFPVPVPVHGLSGPVVRNAMVCVPCAEQTGR